ncbi:PIG-L deacetylase family protein [Pseudobacteroides cellulosolvens]|uniref:LmbE family protein n=1 Tax=Pseudobacteroides cellulosolvens ATCC 35603 = DSM 2933 TaxID=398512 RepID=A0A0L6JNS7_9FIRM|nr:PIG-L family deacetylase [Pseudobacteroides cellulosolvens]KNY27027.1 LmbE family protein [Pseudobacteroides cellulosolvens ATCC 35603 = DSM 2933]
MEFIKTDAEVFIPDGKPVVEALKRTTHMTVSAHHDDIEIMAYHGIAECFNSNSNWFTGVVVTNGAGSSKGEFYSSFSEEEFINIRKLEQKKAAFIGEYSAVAMLNYTSAEAKDPGNTDIIKDLKLLISNAKPEIIYTHNLFDKHKTHISVALKVIEAVRDLEPSERPKKLYGCEVWRSLDWLMSSDRVTFDASANPNIASALIEVYNSQIAGNKEYHKAAIGRRHANATFYSSHTSDLSKNSILGMDLTPLIVDTAMDISLFAKGFIERFSVEALNAIKDAL